MEKSMVLLPIVVSDEGSVAVLAGVAAVTHGQPEYLLSCEEERTAATFVYCETQEFTPTANTLSGKQNENRCIFPGMTMAKRHTLKTL